MYPPLDTAGQQKYRSISLIEATERKVNPVEVKCNISLMWDPNSYMATFNGLFSLVPVNRHTCVFVSTESDFFPL